MSFLEGSELRFAPCYLSLIRSELSLTLSYLSLLWIKTIWKGTKVQF